MPPHTSKQSPKSTAIFTDGASSGNPGPGGWGAILLYSLHLGHSDHSGPTVLEIGGRDPQTTNNRMELKAVIEALRKCDPGTLITVYTDSTYLIRGITQWIPGWIQRDWQGVHGEPIANQDLWKELLEITEQFNITWNHVKGHAGIPGNERADEIAVAFSQNQRPSLYQGSRAEYPIPIHILTPSLTAKGSKKSSKGGKAYSYLSLVSGVPLRHLDWDECEKRVRGQSGARFKKAMNPNEEAQILQAWGFSSDSLPKHPKEK